MFIVKTKIKITQIIILSAIAVFALSAGALLAFKSPTDQLGSSSNKASAISDSPKNGEFFNGEKKVNPNVSNTKISQTQDSDQDGLTDEEERRYGTNPYAKDSDNDGLSDGEEVKSGFSPTEPNQANAIQTASQLSSDLSTDASSGLSAGPTQCSAPSANLTNIAGNSLSADDDNDGLSNLLEEQYNTEITNPDTDGDGYLDGDEVRNGYDPTNPLPVKLNTASASASKQAVLFYGETCPYSQNVLSYIKANNIESAITLEKNEVYNNQQNAQDLIQISSACGITQEQVSVPLLYINNQCYSGEDKITDYLKQFAGAGVALGGNTRTLATTVNKNTELTPAEQNILNTAQPKILSEIADTEIIINPQTSQANLKQYFTEIENAVKIYLSPLQEQVLPDGSAEISKQAIISNVQKGYQAMKVISVPAEAKEFHKLTMSIFKGYENLTNLKQENFSTAEELQSEALSQIMGLQLALGEFNKKGEELANKYSIDLN